MSTKDKRYYWLKLKRDFFKRHDIQIIESMPNGKDYILFYLKLLCESVDHEGNLRFSEQIPYNEQMLSTITNTNIDIVRSAIKIFSELHMMDVMDDGTYYMNEVNKMLGSESYWAQKKRNQRAIETKKLDNVQRLSNDCPTCPSKSIDIEIDKDIDIDSDKEPQKKPQAKKEEKKKAAPYVADDDLNNAIIAFIDYRKKIKKPMTDRAIQLLLNKLNELSPNVKEQIEILNQSVLNGWQGIFPLKESNNQNGKPIRQEVVPVWMNKKHLANDREYDFDSLNKQLFGYSSNESQEADPEFAERKAELEKRLKEKYGKEKEESKTCQT